MQAGTNPPRPPARTPPPGRVPSPTRHPPSAQPVTTQRATKDRRSKTVCSLLLSFRAGSCHPTAAPAVVFSASDVESAHLLQVHRAVQTQLSLQPPGPHFIIRGVVRIRQPGQVGAGGVAGWAGRVAGWAAKSRQAVDSLTAAGHCRRRCSSVQARWSLPHTHCSIWCMNGVSGMPSMRDLSTVGRAPSTCSVNVHK